MTAFAQLEQLEHKVNKVAKLAEKLTYPAFINKMNAWFARKRSNPTLYMLKLLKFKRKMMNLCNVCIVKCYGLNDAEEDDEESEEEDEEFNNEFTRSLYLSESFSLNHDNIVDKMMELTVRLSRHISIIHTLFTEYYPRPVRLIHIDEEEEDETLLGDD